MQVKIQSKKTFFDGQTIYIIGGVKPYEFHKFYKDTEDNAWVMEWSDQQRAHFALRRAIRHHLPEMANWIATNKAETTYWVDPDIFKAMTQDTFTDFPWGIGFKKDDPLESWFVMRWA